MDDLVRRENITEIITDDEARAVTVGEYDHTVFFGETANERGFLRLREDPKSIRCDDVRVYNAGELDLVVFSFYDDRS